MLEAVKLLSFNPIFQVPLWTSILICISCSMMGALLFVQKKSLLGETLSHAAYPGIILGGWLFFESLASFSLLFGGVLFTLLASFLIEWCIRKKNMAQDTALSLVLASFWGLGVLLISRLQFAKVAVFREVKVFLFGQAATLNMQDLYLSCFFFFGFVFFLLLFFHPLKAFLWDPKFTSLAGLPVKGAKFLITSLLVCSLVVSMKCIGIVLLMGMLVAPPIFARQFTDKLSVLLVLSGLIGAFSAFLGNLIPLTMIQKGVNLPTGPLIISLASFFAIAAMFFAPHKGYVYKLVQLHKFRIKKQEENLVKFLWKNPEVSLQEIKDWGNRSFLFYFLYKLKKEGFLQKKEGKWSLTSDGLTKASRIIRLHRLWELYLVHQMNLKVDEVHPHAEEMEHVLTEDLESKLEQVLARPSIDPHDQPIPRQ